MDERMIEQKAIDTIAQINYCDDSEEIDVIQIAKRLGFSVGNAVLQDDVDGFILVQDDAKEILGIETNKLIGVNSKRNLEWKRFIIAHELAHYILHCPEQKTKGMYAHRDHKKGKGSTENEADFFAANLLMPREKFTEKFNELKEKSLDKEDIVLLLTKKFVVTPKMVERRFEELSLDV